MGMWHMMKPWYTTGIMRRVVLKSDQWLLRKIVEEFITKRDIAYLRKLLANGHSDDQALEALRERMCSNAKGMKTYIRNEKVKALTLKLSYRIHWTYIHAVIRKWLHEKEVLIRWKEDRHGPKVNKKAHDLKADLLSEGGKLKCMSFDHETMEDFILKIESAAEKILAQIEKEEGSLK